MCLLSVAGNVYCYYYYYFFITIVCRCAMSAGLDLTSRRLFWTAWVIRKHYSRVMMCAYTSIKKKNKMRQWRVPIIVLSYIIIYVHYIGKSRLYQTDETTATVVSRQKFCLFVVVGKVSNQFITKSLYFFPPFGRRQKKYIYFPRYVII